MNELSFEEQIVADAYMNLGRVKATADKCGMEVSEVRRLLSKGRVKEYISTRRAQSFIETMVTPDRIIEAIAEVAFTQVGESAQVRPSDILKACELLGKWNKTNMFKEVVESISKEDAEAERKRKTIEERLANLEKSRADILEAKDEPTKPDQSSG